MKQNQGREKYSRALFKWWLIVIGLVGFWSLIIGVKTMLYQNRTPEIFPNYPGPTCDGQTTIAVTADGNKTKVRVSSKTPYSWVEIRVTSSGQTTPYQNPSVSDNGDWVIWEWVINNAFNTVTSVQFYTDVFELGQGGIVCVGWEADVCYDFNGDNVLGAGDLMYVLEHWNTYNSQKGVTLNVSVLMEILQGWNLNC